MSKSSEVLYVKSDASQEQKTYKRPWSQPVVALISFFLGVGSSLGLGIGGFYLMGDSWMSFNEVTGTYYTMTTVSVTSIVCDSLLLSVIALYCLIFYRLLS